ncbi:MAG: HprK-related kinase B [Gammaproteobacteria bacterium]
MSGVKLDTLAEAMLGEAVLVDDSLTIDLPGANIRIRSNSAELLEGLKDYFAHVLTDSGSDSDMEVIAVERPSLELGLGMGLEFRDWTREPGKKGRKDSIHEFPGGRLVHKVRTGMLFLQSQKLRLAAGPCLANDNQVINFINAQYMNVLQNSNWLICHAAALVQKESALAIAGLSGGGKSTLMLHMLEQPSTAFVSNDRLFIKHQAGRMMARGIPKMPRINPGTIVHNQRLKPLIPTERRAELLALPQAELWSLEEKYDAPVEALYGKGRVQHEAPLSGLLILNWQLGGSEPTQVQQVDIKKRSELLAAVMKSPGPFYQNSQGEFLTNGHEPKPDQYSELLAQVPVYEATGSIDFQSAANQIRQLLNK